MQHAINRKIGYHMYRSWISNSMDTGWCSILTIILSYFRNLLPLTVPAELTLISHSALKGMKAFLYENNICRFLLLSSRIWYLVNKYPEKCSMKKYKNIKDKSCQNKTMVLLINNFLHFSHKSTIFAEKKEKIKLRIWFFTYYIFYT